MVENLTKPCIALVKLETLAFLSVSVLHKVRKVKVNLPAAYTASPSFKALAKHHLCFFVPSVHDT